MAARAFPPYYGTRWLWPSQFHQLKVFIEFFSHNQLNHLSYDAFYYASEVEFSKFNCVIRNAAKVATSARKLRQHGFCFSKLKPRPTYYPHRLALSPFVSTWTHVLLPRSHVLCWYWWYFLTLPTTVTLFGVAAGTFSIQNSRKMERTIIMREVSLRFNSHW